VLTRQRFIGFVENPTFPVPADNFKPLDADYFRRVRAACEVKLADGAKWRG
jgi:tRNA (mo5U34)-methyltransferase